MNKLINILKCGNVYDRPIGVVVLTVSNFKDIYEKIISLFSQYKIIGIKSLDFEDSCKIVEIVKRRNHLTERLKQIRVIKLGMNKESSYKLIFYIIKRV